MKQLTTAVLLLGISGVSSSVLAGDVEIQFVEMRKTGKSWHFSVRVKHADTGWKHYADGWRVVDKKTGKVLGTRTLYHPHVNEQPFTRSLGGVKIPAGTKVIYVEAHDKIHGWAKKKLIINLSVGATAKYKIIK